MTEHYIPRSLEPVLAKALTEFPVVVLIGPRQSGKTTLLKHMVGSQWPVISLEPPDVRAAAISDPRGFLELYPPPVVYDEIQYAPDLLPYIKEQVDARRDQAGQFILTGSQNLLLMQQVTESLAGRSAVLKLLPMSQREIAGDPQRLLPWEMDRPLAASDIASSGELWSRILRGSYPELVANPQRDARLWQASYVQTYLERDVRNLRNIGDLTQFQILPAQPGNTQRRTAERERPGQRCRHCSQHRQGLAVHPGGLVPGLPAATLFRQHWASGW